MRTKTNVSAVGALSTMITELFIIVMVHSPVQQIFIGCLLRYRRYCYRSWNTGRQTEISAELMELHSNGAERDNT